MLPQVLLFTALAALWGIGCCAFTKACAPFARPSLPERPCCREVMLGEDLRPSLPERPCRRELVVSSVLWSHAQLSKQISGQEPPTSSLDLDPFLRTTRVKMFLPRERAPVGCAGGNCEGSPSSMLIWVGGVFSRNPAPTIPLPRQH